MLLFLIFTFCSSDEINYAEGQKYQTREFTGTWLFDCWGADGGGSAFFQDTHSKGAFLSVQIKFPEDTPTTLYFFAGQTPEANIVTYPDSPTDYYIPGGLYHGGSGGKLNKKPASLSEQLKYGGGGGGFTGISLSPNELESIVVAGSGGGAIQDQKGSPGGNISHCLQYDISGVIFTGETIVIECHNDGVNGQNGEIPTGAKISVGPGGGGAGFPGGPAGTYHNIYATDAVYYGYGKGGRSFVADNEDTRLTSRNIQIVLIETLAGNEVTENNHPKTELHGKFVMTKIIDCDSQVCEETEDCLCSQCKDPHCDRCAYMSGICLQCKSPYLYDKTSNRCYVDSEPFSESFDFTVSEDFSKSFIFNATDVFSPTRSERVIIVPDSDTKFIIIGCVVGGVVVIAAVVILAVVICRRKKLPFTSNADENSMKETVIPMQEDQLTVDDSSDSSMLSQHADDPFLPVNQQNEFLAE